MLSIILGLAGAVASAAGTLAAGKATGAEGLSEKLKAISLRGQAGTIESNARLSNMFLDYQTAMQQREMRIEGLNAEAGGNYLGKQLDRKGRSDFARGQSDMFELQRQGKEVSSTFQATAAASGFVPTSGDLSTQANDLEQRTSYLSKMALYGAKIERDTSFAQADASRTEGRYENTLSQWRSNVLGGQTQLEKMMNTMTAQRQAFATMTEASGYKSASYAAQSAAKRNQMLSYFGAGSTLLGAGGTAYSQYTPSPSASPASATPLK